MLKTVSIALSLAVLSVGFAASAQPGSANSAAGNEAMRAFMAQRQNCGDKTVTAIDVTPAQGGFAAPLDTRQGKPHTLYFESSGLEGQWSGQLGRMTEADRLNGLQWKGRVQMTAKATRHISVTRGGGGPNGAWSQWQSNVNLGTVEVEQRNGVWSTKEYWQLLEGLGRFGKLRRPSCAEVPA